MSIQSFIMVNTIFLISKEVRKLMNSRLLNATKILYTSHVYPSRKKYYQRICTMGIFHFFASLFFKAGTVPVYTNMMILFIKP